MRSLRTARDVSAYFGCLFDQRCQDARVAMSLIDRRICADAVEIAAPLDVEEPHALGALDDEVERRVVVRAVRFVEVDESLRDPSVAQHNSIIH